MQSFKKIITIILFLGISLFFSPPAFSQTVAGTTFPYARIDLRTPTHNDPFPGLGTYYSALSDGINTARWNPASLMKIEHAQGNLSLSGATNKTTYNYNYATDDSTLNLGSQTDFSVGYYFTGDETVSTAAKREHTAKTNYTNQTTQLNFAQALKVNDWLAVGVLNQSNSGFSLDISGAFPIIGKSRAEFYNTTNILNAGFSIDPSGYITYVHTPEGGDTYTYQTAQPLWSGFLRQNSNIPITVLSEARNALSLDPGPTFCGAIKWDKFSFGANLTPVSVTANINNSARAVVDEGTTDMLIYLPDIDASNEEEVLAWLQDPNFYGSEIGYKTNKVNVPAGEVVAEAAYKGYYQAAAIKTDLGLTYDWGENTSIALVLENFGGAAFNFRGKGRVAYVNSRVSTSEPTGYTDPTQNFQWDLFKDEFEAVEGTEDYSLQEALDVTLPKKLRIGLAFKKPLLIAIDYEQNQTPIYYTEFKNGGENLITISNIRLLRLGMESQLLFFPVRFRFGLPLLFKPDISGLDANTTDAVNKYFQYGVLPAGLDLGLDTHLWGAKVGANTCLNLTSILSLYQLDIANDDLGKSSFYNLYIERDAWKFTYLSSLDIGATGVAYSNRPEGEDSFKWEYVKWLQMFTISYKF